MQFGWCLYVCTVCRKRKCDLRHLAKSFVIVAVTDIYKQGFQLLRVLLKNTWRMKSVNQHESEWNSSGMKKPWERTFNEHQICLNLELRESNWANYGCRTECKCYKPWGTSNNMHNKIERWGKEGSVINCHSSCFIVNLMLLDWKWKDS